MVSDTSFYHDFSSVESHLMKIHVHLHIIRPFVNDFNINRSSHDPLETHNYSKCQVQLSKTVSLSYTLV